MKMKKPIKTFEKFEVVLVPFPFTDSKETKNRPALILSSAKHFNARIGKSIMTMITTEKPRQTSWPLDIKINDLDSAGLPAPSIIRFKLFTLEHELVLKRIGELAESDRQDVEKTLKKVFDF